MLTFRDSNRSFKLDEDLLETMIIYNFILSNFNPQDRKLFHEFGKEMDFEK